MINEQRIETIAQATLAAIRDNYRRGPDSRDRVWEALNALAGCAALIIAGCDEAPAAKEFFLKALAQNIAGLERMQ